MTADRDEWLAWRQSGIGASDVPIICGLAPWGSAWQVWADKLGRIPPIEATPKMKAGSRLERIITEMLAEDEGIFVAGEQTWCAHPEHRHHLATVDGFRVEGPNSQPADALGLVEYKFHADWAHWNTIPDHYQVQVQWQLHVTGLDRAWVCALRQGYDLRVYELERDQAVIDRLVEIADGFWALVQTQTPPAADDRDDTGKAIAAVYPQSAAVKKVIPDELVIELRLARIDADRADKRLMLAHNQIKALLADADTAVDDQGQIVATWKTSSSSRLDGAALKDAHPDIYAKFTRTSDSRRFLPKDPK